MTHDNQPNLVLVDQKALLDLVAELERRFCDYVKHAHANEQELLRQIAAQTAKQTGEPLPVPVHIPQYDLMQQFHPVPAQHFQPETQHLITRIFDQLLPFFPSLWQIRPFIDQITWKKLLLFVVIIIIAANTAFGATLTNTMPVLKPALDLLHFKALDQTKPAAKEPACHATATPAPQTDTSPTPQSQSASGQ